jgi:hypothetical protein
VYIFAFLLYTVYFLLYTVYFCCILEKNTNGKHISGAPFLISVAHPICGAPKWGAPQILCVAHALGCATGTTHSHGAYRRAPQIKYTSGLICVAHHRCATKPQNGAPQIGFLLVVAGQGEATAAVWAVFDLGPDGPGMGLILHATSALLHRRPAAGFY